MTFMSDEGYQRFSNEYVRFSPFSGVVVYRPEGGPRAKSVTVVMMHSDDVYYGFVPGPELARRGYTVVAGAVQRSEEPFDQKVKDLAQAVSYAREIRPNDRLVLLGHSGGASLVSAYQAIAENGEKIFQDEGRIVPLPSVGKLVAADAVMFLDANFGNGVMTVMSLEPGLVDEDCGRRIDPAFDLFSAENGWSDSGVHYSDEFVSDYVHAQEERNARLIDYALGRLAAVEAGKGRFVDDEPMTIVGGNQFAPCNRLFPQDLRYLSHTEGEWPVIHPDGSVGTEVVRSRRLPRKFPDPAAINGLSTKQTTVRNFLTNCAVRTRGFHYDASHVYGVEWGSAFCNSIGNMGYIHVPALVMGNTGSYEFLAAEQVYDGLGSESKTIAFVEGASHNFTPQMDAETHPGEFGDTVRHCFDRVASWLGGLR